MDDTIYVRDSLQCLPGQASASGIAGSETCGLVDFGFHFAFAGGSAPRGGRNYRSAFAAAERSRRTSVGGSGGANRIPACGRTWVSEPEPFGSDTLRRGGAAYPAGHADRFTVAWSAVCAR